MSGFELLIYAFVDSRRDCDTSGRVKREPMHKWQAYCFQPDLI